MELVQLGRSSIQISRVVLGTQRLGTGAFALKHRINTIRAAIDAGATTLDTAPLYGFGTSEATIGRAIRGLRDRVQIVTKVGLRWDDTAGDPAFVCHDERGREVIVRRNARPESIRLEVERSLWRLGVDTLDLVVLEAVDPRTPVEDAVGALDDLRREGKLRGIGVSTAFSAAQVMQAQRALGEEPLAAVQVRYSLIDRAQESLLITTAREWCIGVIAHGAFERGLLCRRFSPARALRDGGGRTAIAHQAHPDNVRRVAAAMQRGVEPVASRHGATLPQVVLAWVLAQPAVCAVAVGASSPEQARANAEAADLVLSADELQAISCVFEHLRLDPYAGLSAAQRMYSRTRRVTGDVRRRVARAVSGIVPLPLGDPDPLRAAEPRSTAQ